MPELFKLSTQHKTRFIEKKILTSTTSTSKDIRKTSEGSIEKILLGSWNAAKWWPEQQEKWLYHTVYEKYIYPKLSPEQKKKAKAIEPKIKKYAKAGGWVMTGAEIIIAGVIVKKLYKGVRKWKEQRQRTRGSPRQVTTNSEHRYAPDDVISQALRWYDENIHDADANMVGEGREQTKQMLDMFFSVAPDAEVATLFSQALHQPPGDHRQELFSEATKRHLQRIVRELGGDPEGKQYGMWRGVHMMLEMTRFQWLSSVDVDHWKRSPKTIAKTFVEVVSHFDKILVGRISSAMDNLQDDRWKSWFETPHLKDALATRVADFVSLNHAGKVASHISEAKRAGDLSHQQTYLVLAFMAYLDHILPPAASEKDIADRTSAAMRCVVLWSDLGFIGVENLGVKLLPE